MSGKVVVVTGASGGIGRAAAVAFARRGMRVALLARGARGLAGAAREVEAAGGQALIVQADVADCEQVEHAADRVEREWGGIEIWVNNAMLTVFASVAKLPAEELRRVTEVTYLGAVHGTMAALRRMRPRDRGAIVQVGSALAYRSIPLQAAYCGAKHALRGFTDALRCELLHDHSGVRVISVHLAAFNTPQFDWARNHMGERPQPLEPIFQPELAGQAIEWAARQRRREVFVGFSAIQAVYGNKLAPGLLDRMMAHKAWSGQLSGEKLPPDAGDNLFVPHDIDPGARGRFNRQARDTSLQFWFTMRRRFLLSVLAAVLLALAALLAI